MDIIDSRPPADDAIDFDALDPGIRAVVRWLRRNGFNTCDSGDGESKLTRFDLEPADIACALTYPHVFMVVEPADMLVPEADRLRALVEGAGLQVLAIGEARSGGWAHIEARYDPANGVGLIALLNVHDGMLPWVS
jgi:hypothetical protein